MIELVIAGLAGLTVWMVAARWPRTSPAVAERVAALVGKSPARRGIRRTSPEGVLAGLGGRLPGNRETLSGMLARCGSEWPADAVVGARFLGAAAGLVAGLPLGWLALVGAPGLALVGYRLPDLVLSARARGRGEELARELPDLVDLLAVCTQAGLNLSLSLKRVAAAAPGVLGEELRRTVEEIDLGVPRAAALEGLGSRNEVPALEELVTILVGAERFGTRVSAALLDFAETVRLSRRRMAEERARKAPVKMLFPLVFLILPGFILLTLVPLLLGTFQSLGF